MTSPQGSAADSGTFAIGGDLTVHRLGFGAMRITGPGIWGEPADHEKAKATLRRVPELGIDLIDTADSYGPVVSEDLIREVLHPYDGLVVATKGGLTRHGPDVWRPVGNPDYLRQCVMMRYHGANATSGTAVPSSVLEDEKRTRAERLGPQAGRDLRPDRTHTA